MQLKVEKHPMEIEIPKNLIESAEVVGLAQAIEQNIIYLDVNGKQIRDATTIQRINSLAIPPAYTHVWICPFENGHLQATGRDGKGRKQYRLAEIGRCTSQTAAKKNITQAIKSVAAFLGSRPATCRKYYVYPAVLAAYLDGSLLEIVEKQREIAIDDRYILQIEELIVMSLVQQRSGLTADSDNE